MSTSPSANATPADPGQTSLPHRAFSPARAWAIALNTLTELVRLKVFYFLVIFGLLVIGNSAFMLKFSFQEEFQVLKDVAFGAMSIFSSLLAIVATAFLLPNDVEDRTLYTILAKPVPRVEYLLGKLVGTLLLLAIALSAMFAMLLAVMAAREQWVLMELHSQMADAPPEALAAEVAKVREAAFNWNLLPGLVTVYLKAALLASLTLFISTFASSGLFTVIIAVAVYFVGHLQATAREYWLTTSEGASPIVRGFLALVSLVFPDLQMFNLVDDIVAGNAIEAALFLKTCALGCLYVIIYFLLGLFSFSNKEL